MRPYSLAALVAALIAGAANVAAQEPGQRARLEKLQGVWEQTDILYDCGTMAFYEPGLLPMMRQWLVVSGGESFQVYGSLGALVHPSRVLLGEPAEQIDFVSAENGRTVRGLYKFLPIGLAICQNDWGKTLTRPGAVRPAPGGFIVRVYSRRAPPETKPGAVGVKPLAGMWGTVGFERGGVDLRGEANGIALAKERRAFYITGGAYAMFEAEELLRLKMTHQPYHFKPKEGKNAIDFMGNDGKAIPAIFDLHGDKLRICWNRKSGKRPDAMRTDDGDGRELIILERVGGREPEGELKKGLRNGS